MSAASVVVRPLRMAWRRLTSMRTALILLFLLAVAAVPGSLLPQRPLNPGKTDQYIKAHGGWGRFLDAVGMFDVFGSVWFAAIYLLLFVSLVGCLVPRIRVHARAVVRKPLPAPRHLDRLPESGRFETSATPEAYASAARQVLGRRWRVERRVEDTGAVTLSAEKGYSRETGNLIFHVALLAALLLIAVGRLYSYEGTNIVVQGTGFCNTVSALDSWKPGRFAAEGKVQPAPFCITDLRKFTATYTDSGEPRSFAADLRYQSSPAAPVQERTISVNHPLRLEGDRVYLTGHGFAPKVTVTMPDGSTRTSAYQAFLPKDATTLLSEGVFKLQGRPGAKDDVGIEGLFAPDPIDEGNGLITSRSAQTRNPVLSVFVYTGDLNFTGLPQSVYALDKTKLKKVGALNLKVGQTKSLANGVKVRFDGWQPYANLQISHDPAQSYLLIAAVAMVVGLFGSLAVRRRRLWLRVAPADQDRADGPTVVSVGGLARSDSGNFTAEFGALLDRLRQAAAPVTEGYHSSLHLSRDEDADAIRAGKD